MLDRITKVSRSLKNNSETITNEHNKEIPRERYISPEERQKITDDQIRFRPSMLRSSLCDYIDAYILVKGTITVAEETAGAPNNANKKVIFKNCVPFTNCISRINNTQVDDGNDIDLEMPMYNLIEYSDNYSKML